MGLHCNSYYLLGKKKKEKETPQIRNKTLHIK